MKRIITFKSPTVTFFPPNIQSTRTKIEGKCDRGDQLSTIEIVIVKSKPVEAEVFYKHPKPLLYLCVGWWCCCRTQHVRLVETGLRLRTTFILILRIQSCRYFSNLETSDGLLVLRELIIANISKCKFRDLYCGKMNFFLFYRKLWFQMQKFVIYAIYSTASGSLALSLLYNTTLFLLYFEMG